MPDQAWFTPTPPLPEPIRAPKSDQEKFAEMILNPPPVAPALEAAFLRRRRLLEKR